MSEPEETTETLSENLQKLSVESQLELYECSFDLEAAQYMLDNYNNTNRPIRRSIVNEYANTLLLGRWKLNGEPIIFGSDDEGNESLISGQHRLLALVEANKLHAKNPDKYPDAQLQLHTAVVKGVILEAADTNDTGVARKHADVLFRDPWIDSYISEYWNANNARRKKWVMTLANAARLVWLRSGGMFVSSSPKFNITEMLSFIKDEHSPLCDFVTGIIDASILEGGGLKISLGYLAALCYVASLNEDGSLHKETGLRLIESMKIISTCTAKPGSPEHALLTYWNTMYSEAGSKDRDLEIIGPVVKGIKAIINDEKVTAAKLKLSKKEADSYKIDPPLFEGFDTACFIATAEKKSNLLEMAEQAKADREKAKLEREAEKEKAKAEKEKEKALAKSEAKEPQKTTIKLPPKPKTFIKRKPVQA